MVSSNLDAATEIAEIVADLALHAEAKAVCGKIAARASGVGEAGVRLALQPLVLVYGLGEQAKSPAFWQAYNVLAGVPADAMAKGVQDYLAAPDSHFFPKPGPLKALCDKHAEPIFKAAFRLTKAASTQPDRRTPPTEAEREAVHRMAEEVARTLKAGAAKHWPERSTAPQPSIAGKPDETGITPQMRELLNRQRSQ